MTHSLRALIEEADRVSDLETQRDAIKNRPRGNLSPRSVFDADERELGRLCAEHISALLQAGKTAIGLAPLLKSALQRVEVPEAKRWYWSGDLCHFVDGIITDSKKHSEFNSALSPPVVLWDDYDALRITFALRLEEAQSSNVALECQPEIHELHERLALAIKERDQQERFKWAANERADAAEQAAAQLREENAGLKRDWMAAERYVSDANDKINGLTASLTAAQEGRQSRSDRDAVLEWPEEPSADVLYAADCAVMEHTSSTPHGGYIRGRTGTAVYRAMRAAHLRSLQAPSDSPDAGGEEK